MTLDKFITRHGPEYDTFKRTPLFIDLMAVLEEYSPHRKSCSIDTRIATQTAENLLGMIQGYASVQDILQNKLGSAMEITMPEATFADANEVMPA